MTPYLLFLILGTMTAIYPSFLPAAILFPNSHLTLLDVFLNPHLPALGFAAYIAVPFSVFLNGWDTNWCRAHLFPAKLTFCICRCQSQASNKVQNNNRGECMTITELGLAHATAHIWFCNGFSDFFSPFFVYQESLTFCHFCLRYRLRLVLILSGSEHHDQSANYVLSPPQNVFLALLVSVNCSVAKLPQ